MKSILTLSLLLFVSACAKPDPAQDYVDRLSKVLNVDPPSPNTHKLKFPDQRSLEVSAPQNSISIKSFLGLRQCELHQVLAERNSQLGRVAKFSQRFHNG